jgi:hypothetical protein
MNEERRLGESEWTEQRIKQLQALNDIALRNLGLAKSPMEDRCTGAVPIPLYAECGAA